jgi:periplasmic divalent cation tolerance protein
MKSASGECIVQTTIDHDDKAEVFARGLLDARLCACVTRLPAGVSMYRFESTEITVEPEIVLLIKTHEHKLNELEAYFRQHHPYTVPEILVFRADSVAASYSAWLHEELRLA